MNIQSTLDLIAEYYTKLSEAEVDQDATRKVLNTNYDFSPATLHMHIAKDRDAISTLDLLHFMASLGETIEFTDCFQLIMSLSPLSIHKIKIREFLDFVCNREYWNNFQQRKLFGEAPYIIRFLLSQLFKKELAILKLMQDYSKIICSCQELNIYSLFATISSHHEKGITESDISTLMKAHSSKPYVSSIAIKALLRRLDRDKDGVVSYVDFFDTIKFYEHLDESKPSPIDEITDKITPPKESNPQKSNPELLDEVRRPIAFDEIAKPSNDIFDAPTKSLFNRFSKSYSNFKLHNNPETKQEAIKLLKEAKKALQSSFENLNKSIGNKKANN